MELSHFLRTRRQRLTPQKAGLQTADMSRRRTRGLRREEVSALAGISLPWYTSLEQGRDINVSDQVLESLARTLRLSEEERNHLFFLANARTRPAAPKSGSALLPDSLRFMLDQMPVCPAYITDAKLNVLASNRLASLVFDLATTQDEREQNIIWRMFMLPSFRAMYVNWDSLARTMLGHFRMLYTRNIEDPWYTDFIAALTEASPEFAGWWNNYEIRCMNRHPQVLEHPEAGLLNLSSHFFHLQDGNNYYMTVFTPNFEDGSDLRLAALAERDHQLQK